MATYRERREARANRLEEWAQKRTAKANAAFAAEHEILDAIPMGQPILVDHYSAKRHRRDLARAHALMEKAITNTDKARDFSGRAANIRKAANAAIYSDDPDAVKALEARIADLEAERDRVKAYNASCRKGTPDISQLDERQRADIANLERIGFGRPDRSFPAYHLSNLSGNIKRQRDRLAKLATA